MDDAQPDGDADAPATATVAQAPLPAARRDRHVEQAPAVGVAASGLSSGSVLSESASSVNVNDAGAQGATVGTYSGMQGTEVLPVAAAAVGASGANDEADDDDAADEYCETSPAAAASDSGIATHIRSDGAEAGGRAAGAQRRKAAHLSLDANASWQRTDIEDQLPDDADDSGGGQAAPAVTAFRADAGTDSEDDHCRGLSAYSAMPPGSDDHARAYPHGVYQPSASVRSAIYATVCPSATAAAQQTAAFELIFAAAPWLEVPAPPQAQRAPEVAAASQGPPRAATKARGKLPTSVSVRAPPSPPPPTGQATASAVSEGAKQGGSRLHEQQATAAQASAAQASARSSVALPSADQSGNLAELPRADQPADLAEGVRRVLLEAARAASCEDAAHRRRAGTASSVAAVDGHAGQPGSTHPSRAAPPSAEEGPQTLTTANYPQHAQAHVHGAAMPPPSLARLPPSSPPFRGGVVVDPRSKWHLLLDAQKFVQQNSLRTHLHHGAEHEARGATEEDRMNVEHFDVPFTPSKAARIVRVAMAAGGAALELVTILSRLPINWESFQADMNAQVKMVLRRYTYRVAADFAKIVAEVVHQMTVKDETTGELHVRPQFAHITPQMLREILQRAKRDQDLPGGAIANLRTFVTQRLSGSEAVKTYLRERIAAGEALLRRKVAEFCDGERIDSAIRDDRPLLQNLRAVLAQASSAREQASLHDEALASSWNAFFVGVGNSCLLALQSSQKQLRELALRSSVRDDSCPHAIVIKWSSTGDSRLRINPLKLREEAADGIPGYEALCRLRINVLSTNDAMDAAVTAGRYESVKYLVDRAKGRSLWQRASSDGLTPIQRATRLGYLPIVELLGMAAASANPTVALARSAMAGYDMIMAAVEDTAGGLMEYLKANPDIHRQVCEVLLAGAAGAAVESAVPSVGGAAAHPRPPLRRTSSARPPRQQTPERAESTNQPSVLALASTARLLAHIAEIVFRNGFEYGEMVAFATLANQLVALQLALKPRLATGWTLLSPSPTKLLDRAANWYSNAMLDGSLPEWNEAIERLHSVHGAAGPAATVADVNDMARRICMLTAHIVHLEGENQRLQRDVVVFRPWHETRSWEAPVGGGTSSYSGAGSGGRGGSHGGGAVVSGACGRHGSSGGGAVHCEHH